MVYVDSWTQMPFVTILKGVWHRIRVVDLPTWVHCSIVIRITFTDTQDFSIQFDFIKMRFLDRINVMVAQLPANIIYQSELGVAQYSASSNSINIGSWDSSSLVAIAELNRTEAECGEVLLFNMTIQNVGNQIANNIPAAAMANLFSFWLR